MGEIRWEEVCLRFFMGVKVKIHVVTCDYICSDNRVLPSRPKSRKCSKLRGVRPLLRVWGYVVVVLWWGCGKIGGSMSITCGCDS